MSSEAVTCPHCGAPGPTAPRTITKTPLSRKRPLILAGGAVGILTAGALAFSLLGGAPLSERYPAGAEACNNLAFSLERENGTVALGSLLAAGKAADLADTEAIRASVTDPSEGIDLPAGVDRSTFLIADAKKLRAACEAEDVSMPPLKGRQP